MNLIVKLWGEEIGRLNRIPSSKLIQFTFNPNLHHRPDFAPLLCPVGRWNPHLPFLGFEERLYQGLPPFIADSLPDSWGNTLFEQWAHENKISSSQISPLYKLMFIGTRGMGALEFEPQIEGTDFKGKINIKELYDLSLEIAANRNAYSIADSNDLSFKSLIAAGTSAGGRQMKALIALNKEADEIRSGQSTPSPDYEYYIIKFEDALIPSSEIEMIYYEMAIAAGIHMEECRLLEIDGINHFITRRFDRRNGEKIHMQTLAAINPEAKSYESLFETARRIGLGEEAITELYRRMVFNILTGNTDDHNKNVSFLYDRNRSWSLAPAYDLTFIFNRFATGPELGHSLSLNGKFDNFFIEDLMIFARDNGIKRPEKIIQNVGQAIEGFPSLAVKYRLDSPWKEIILVTLNENLRNFGLKKKLPTEVKVGAHIIRDITIKRNQKGIYDIKALIDGIPQGHFLGPKDLLFSQVSDYLSGTLTESELASLLTRIFNL